MPKCDKYPDTKTTLIIFILFLFSCVSCGTKQSEPSSLVRNQALYVTMRDGVKIAIDVWLPPDLEPGAKIPAIMRSTRYWRAVENVNATLESDQNYDEAQQFNEAGYALIVVDARGSGASFGTRPYELMPEEVKDYGEVAEWIISQAWSNGRVGAYGVSYAGNTAEMLAVSKHPAVKAVAPLFNDFDNFGHLVFPGGLLCLGFLKGWSDSVHNMDMNDICALRGVTGERCKELKSKVRGVKKVDADADGQILSEAIREHQKNTIPYGSALKYEYRDDPFGPYEIRDVGNLRSPCNYLKEIEESGVAMYIRVGWTDAATVNGAIGRFTTIDNLQDVVIGPWDHGASHDSDPFSPEDKPVAPSKAESFSQMIAFFGKFLKEDGTGSIKKQIKFYTLGSGRWTVTEVWPPEGFSLKKWYFAAGGGLETQPPKNNDGMDRYTINFDATTGRRNRWFTNGGAGDVVYPDRAEEDKKLLTYTSAPMETDIEITGHPLVTLYVASTHEDGAFFVYLEDVSPEGRVTYITEGQLRAVMRKVTDEKPLYRKFGPLRSEKREDAMPLVKGEIAEITFDLWATSVLIKKGHRLRVAIAGADKDSFLRYPKDGGIPTISVSRDMNHPSHIVLPIKMVAE
ncbi:MAG: CocE/NonD family hydrolase [Candidatus Aminicenantes bacterium]|nr:CocE/NonD family hydrolase [Candidatus Aminicenantes bacterium]